MATIEQSPNALPMWKTKEEMIQSIEKQYGAQIARILAESGSVHDQADLVEKLKQAGLNGQSEQVARTYQLHMQEFERKESWLGRWQDRIMTVIKAPLKLGGWVLNKMREHPFITTAVVLGLAGFLGYYYGIPLAQFVAQGGDERTEGVARMMQALPQIVAGGDTPGIGQVPPIIQQTYGAFDPSTIELPGR